MTSVAKPADVSVQKVNNTPAKPTANPSTTGTKPTFTGGSSLGITPELINLILMLIAQLQQLQGKGTPDPKLALPSLPNPQVPPPIAINDKNAKIWGDPHFVGADGEKYDVLGELGKTYNILSDKDFQLNSKFVKWGANQTVMGEIGATMGKDQVKVDSNNALTINGKAMGDGTYQLEKGTVTKQGKTITLKTDEYNVTSKPYGTSGALSLAFASSNVAQDSVMPHGMWGQTADGDGKARKGDQGGTAQGGGVLEKLDGSLSATGDKTTYKLYEVKDIFDTNFNNFNRFRGDFTGETPVSIGAAGTATPD